MPALDTSSCATYANLAEDKEHCEEYGRMLQVHTFDALSVLQSICRHVKSKFSVGNREAVHGRREEVLAGHEGGEHVQVIS